MNSLNLSAPSEALINALTRKPRAGGGLKLKPVLNAYTRARPPPLPGVVRLRLPPAHGRRRSVAERMPHYVGARLRGAQVLVPARTADPSGVSGGVPAQPGDDRVGVARVGVDGDPASAAPR